MKRWNEIRRKFMSGWDKRRNDQLNKVDRAFERSISILQKRYGYTREEAAPQLKKYYSTAWLG